ncbi:MAG: hypothetical protein V4568_09420 [Pseudomonadota bacterium]
MKQLFWKASVTSVLALLAATEASADAIISHTRAGNFTFAGPGPAAVPIAPGVFQTPAFANAASQRFLVLYTAECSVDAANQGTWLDLDIQAVNVATGAVTVLAPTVGTSDAFCTSNGTAGQDNWHMNAVNAVGGGGLPAGNYVIRVVGKVQGGAGQGWLGDSSLTVWR